MVGDDVLVSYGHNEPFAGMDTTRSTTTLRAETMAFLERRLMMPLQFHRPDEQPSGGSL